MLLDNRAPSGGTRARGEVKHRWDDQADRGQRERNDGGAGGRAIKTLFLIFRAAQDNGKAEHEQDVADDRAGNGSFHHAGQAFGERDPRDDQLGRVSEGGVQ